MPGAVVALDAGGPSLRGLLTAVAAAFTLGAPVVPQRLFDDRFQRPFDLDRPLSFLVNPCEHAPAPSRVPGKSEASDRAEPVVAPATGPDAQIENLKLAPLEIFRLLIARRTGFPADSIEPSARLLSDLHLNSINVAELVTRFAAEIGVRDLSAPTEYANAKVAEVVEALTELRSLGSRRTAEDEHPPGVDSWVRAFVTDLVVREPGPSSRSGRSPWQIIASDDYPLREEVARAFGASPEGEDEAGIVLCLPPNPGSKHLTLLLQGAREVADHQQISRLVLLQHGGGGAAFARSLAREHDGLQVSLVDLPIGVQGVAEWAVNEVARASPSYSEAYYEATGMRRVPVLRPLFDEPTDQPLPLRPADVLVVSGGGKGIGAECALALAKQTGVRLGLIGRSPSDDTGLKANLARMKAAGVEVCYEQADVTDPDAAHRAVARIESRLGRVTAILHAAGINRPQLASSLDLETLHATVSVKVEGARNLLAAVDTASLRLLIGFGSIIARIGLRGEVHYGLANEWLERLIDDFAAGHPHCRCMTLHWSVWAGTGMGERLGSLETLAHQGVAALTIDQGVAALERLVRQPPPATAIVITGRFGTPPAVELGGTLPLLRFVERPRVYYPGIELVVDSDISLATDPYLRDHVIGGTAVLPAVFAFEAIAQVVRALTGDKALPAIEGMILRPIVIGDEEKLTIRLAALRRTADRIDIVVRSSADGFQTDHVRAGVPLAGPSMDQEADLLPVLGFSSAKRLALDPDRDLYGKLLFHAGRFRRLAGYTQVSAAGCTAEIASAATERWFIPFLPADLVLGDPGARDAVLHALQVCVPHRRVIPTAVDRILLAPLEASEPYRVIARECQSIGDSYTFDVDVLDRTGEVVEQWRGLTLQAIERLDQPVAWPLPLVGAYVERRLGLYSPGGSAYVGFDLAAQENAATPTVLHRPDGKPEPSDGVISFAYAAGVRLCFHAGCAVGCDLETVAARGEDNWRSLLGRHTHSPADS